MKINANQKKIIANTVTKQNHCQLTLVIDHYNCICSENLTQ